MNRHFSLFSIPPDSRMGQAKLDITEAMPQHVELLADEKGNVIPLDTIDDLQAWRIEAPASTPAGSIENFSFLKC